MMKNFNTSERVDLRKKSTISDSIKFHAIDIQSCMVISAVFVILLLSIFSVMIGPNPNFI